MKPEHCKHRSDFLVSKRYFAARYHLNTCPRCAAYDIILSHNLIITQGANQEISIFMNHHPRKSPCSLPLSPLTVLLQLPTNSVELSEAPCPPSSLKDLDHLNAKTLASSTAVLTILLTSPFHWASLNLSHLPKSSPPASRRSKVS